MDEIIAATICMNSQNNKEQNVAKACALVRQAKDRGAQWVVLPEMFAFFGPYDQHVEAADWEDGPLPQKLAALAKELNIVLFAGSIGERAASSAKENRVYNTTYVFGRDGTRLAKYQKTHLFNLRAADGRKLYCEEDGFLFGDKIQTVHIDGWHVGLTICYDIRFPELFLAMAAKGPLDAVICPAAFTLKTGMDHWELLLRSRAVEHQCFVLASNQYGSHGPDKESYGHSMIIDPWGNKMADTGAREDIAFVRISKAHLQEVRGRLPARANRRPEIYSL